MDGLIIVNRELMFIVKCSVSCSFKKSVNVDMMSYSAKKYKVSMINSSFEVGEFIRNFELEYIRHLFMKCNNDDKEEEEIRKGLYSLWWYFEK